MPVIPLLIAGAVGFGAEELISGLSKSSSTKPQQVALPDPNAASKDASTSVNNQRALLLAAGGQTDYTSGLGVLTGSDVSKTTLVGG